MTLPHPTPTLPSSGQSLQVVDDVFPRAKMSGLYERLVKSPLSNTKRGYQFYFPVEAVLAHGRGEPALLNGFRRYFPDVAEVVVEYLARLVSMVPSLPPGCWIELWSRRDMADFPPYPVYPHIDLGLGSIQLDVASMNALCSVSDSAQAPRPGNAVRALWGTVLHVGPEEIEGGGTSFCTETPVPGAVLSLLNQFVPEEDMLASSKEWIQVPFCPGRVIVFNGALPHFASAVRVQPSLEEPRVTLLANFHSGFDDRIALHEGCGVLPPDLFQIWGAMTDDMQVATHVIMTESGVNFEKVLEIMRLRRALR